MIKTYIGPHFEGVDVYVMGQPFGKVKPGESIVVPDEIATKVEWPETLWQDGPAGFSAGDRPAEEEMEVNE